MIHNPQSGPLHAAQLDCQEQGAVRAASVLLGMPVQDSMSNATVGHVFDLVIDHENHQLTGLLLDESGNFNSVRTLSWNKVKHVKSSGLVIESGVAPSKVTESFHGTLYSDLVALTINHEISGALSELYLDQLSGQILAYQFSNGFLIDAACCHNMVSHVPPANASRSLGVIQDALNWNS